MEKLYCVECRKADSEQTQSLIFEGYQLLDSINGALFCARLNHANNFWVSQSDVNKVTVEWEDEAGREHFVTGRDDAPIMILQDVFDTTTGDYVLTVREVSPSEADEIEERSNNERAACPTIGEVLKAWTN